MSILARLVDSLLALVGDLCRLCCDIVYERVRHDTGRQETQLRLNVCALACYNIDGGHESYNQPLAVAPPYLRRMVCSSLFHIRARRAVATAVPH